MSVIGWNGEILSVEQVGISVMDHGFLYGMTLFETMRTYGGRPFLLERHMKRLTAACKVLRIRYAPDMGTVARHIQDVMVANGLAEAYVRFTISAGENGFGLPVEDYEQPHTLVLVKPLPRLQGEGLYVHGTLLQLLRTKRGGPEADIRFKSGQYMNNIVAKRELAELYHGTKNAEGFMLTQDGYLAEGIISNLFFIKSERLYTPELSTGILPGITRQFVIELAGQLGIVVEEGKYRWEHLWQADEAFLTTSVQELIPVTTLADIEGRTVQVSSGRIGTVTHKLLQLYRQSIVG